MYVLLSLSLAAAALAQSLTAGAACPSGGGNFCAGMAFILFLSDELTFVDPFSPIILRCVNGTLAAGNCNDNVFSFGEKC